MQGTLRLQFGTAATTIGTQWLALQEANGITEIPHILAFEAKGRVQRQTQAAPESQETLTTWQGSVQVYDQCEAEPMVADGLWNWGRLGLGNLVEVDEFRPHMPLHNFYEGHTIANGGNINHMTLEKTQDRIRTVLETCDQLRLVQFLVDMDSSWGGFAHEIMTYMTEECPRAVNMVVGNDWRDPMGSNDIFQRAWGVQDRARMGTRQRINVATSMALLSEIAHLMVPVAMSSSSLPSTRFSSLRFDRSSCADVSTVVATALEVAMSVHQSQSVSELLERVVPSIKVVELCASFPHTTDPTSLLQSISDSVMNGAKDSSSFMTQDPFQNSSLLPSVPPHLMREHNEGHMTKTYYRRLDFRGAFAKFPTLRSCINTFPIAPRDVTLRWSDTSSLTFPATYRCHSLQNASVDAIGNFILSGRTGHYLHATAQLAATSDQRTLYEFTRAGMNSDALEEVVASLTSLADSYTT